ncbi:biosynthetic-type acetolactate synthase large subunit [Desulfallas sp. Bu1-1]|jgi:acetolactate synthase-1/2/3 large subunit|uniref:biosynthetic-type acetolactate synthase large subunit n=1 Tax=Desulfallas sp. Bu1-1 TaxID=2787620 RepID=UPI0018A045A1|nr:biosynthetic-type acetolactate synthase large subunit [Desulfallas sp. Bu1-1]MBF7083433.1 biosynthetic-type acetolactate synthase large subunit [Desulfallas sp. Bu1-1]
MNKTGAQILVESLLAEGVDTIFGYPGGAVLPIYDALYDADLRHILTRHEQGAAHAADGYARASGKPGVCLATSGPGATNLVTGIANAYMDSVPMVAITGQVPTSLLGRDSFQEADITGITLPITKHNYLVKDVKDLARTVREAFYIATTGRPGPVLIDIPRDVSAGMAEYEDPGPVQLPGYHIKLEPDPEQVTRAVRAIEESERPVIYAGGGVINGGAHEELLRLAEMLLAPVATTLMGLGGFPGNHPLSVGMLGMHGSKYANYAVCECDLLIGVGVRFDDRVTSKIEEFAPNATVIHIDIDPAEIGKNVGVDIPVVGDVRCSLRKIIERLQPRLESRWRDKIFNWKKEYPIEYVENGRLKPQEVIQEIYNVTRGNVRVATDVGQHQMWAAHYYSYDRPRTFITSGGLGTMGFGFPAALGVQVACPDENVVCISGDGSFQMNSQELATAVHYNLPVKVAIINNGYLGMVRQWQELFYNRRYAYTEITGPDFVKLAEAYGAAGMRVTKKSEIREAMEEALRIPKPVVIDFPIEREENVLPMVPPGEPINKMLG